MTKVICWCFHKILLQPKMNSDGPSDCGFPSTDPQPSVSSVSSLTSSSCLVLALVYVSAWKTNRHVCIRGMRPLRLHLCWCLARVDLRTSHFWSNQGTQAAGRTSAPQPPCEIKRVPLWARGRCPRCETIRRWRCVLHLQGRMN